MKTVLSFESPKPAEEKGTHTGQDRILRAVQFVVRVTAPIDAHKSAGDWNSKEARRWQLEIVKLLAGKSADELVAIGEDVEQLQKLCGALLSGVGTFGLLRLQHKDNPDFAEKLIQGILDEFAKNPATEEK